MLFEHPAQATSWNMSEMKDTATEFGLEETVCDQCMYGLCTWGSDKGEKVPAKKPTRFMSNSWCILQELSIRCDHSHPHQPLMSGRAKDAAHYPDALCKAICRGLAKQQAYDRTGRVCSGAFNAVQLKEIIATGREESCKGPMPAHWAEEK